MTDREKLVEMLYDISDSQDFSYYDLYDLCEAAEPIADFLISKGVTVREWINVNVQLPQPGERVIATDGEFAGEMYINSRGKWQRYNVNDHSLMMALDILWWQPLPKPPKEG